MPTKMADPEQQEFEAAYQQYLTEHVGSGIIADELELAACDELLRGAQVGGDVPYHGRMGSVKPDEIDYTDPAFVAASSRRAGGSLVGLIVLGTLALAFVGYVILTLLGVGGSSAGVSLTPPAGTLTAVASQTAGAAAAAKPSASAVASPATTPPPVAGGFISVAGQALPTMLPDSLEIGGRSLLIYVAPVVDRNWQIQKEASVANWLPGSISNWSFMLDLDSDTGAHTWLAQLQPGIAATIRIKGQARPFKIDSRQMIQRTQTEYLNPHQAGLTVFIKAGSDTPGDNRLKLHGQEVAEVAGGSPTPTSTVGR